MTDSKVIDELNRLVQPMSVLGHRRLLRALIYGDTGAGKTSLAVKCVERKGLAITSDSAWVVIEKYPEVAEKWDRVPFQGFSQVRAIADAHNEGVDRWAEYDTLLWDPTSAAVNTMLRKVADIHKVEVEGWPEYRKVERYLTDTIEALNNTQLNVIYTAHVKFPSENDVKNKGFYALRPSMPEASYNAIAREVQLIGYMFREEKGSERKIQFESTRKVTAKTQIVTIPEGTYDSKLVPGMINDWKGLT